MFSLIKVLFSKFSDRGNHPTRQEIGVRAVAERERGVAAMAMVAAAPAIAATLDAAANPARGRLKGIVSARFYRPPPLRPRLQSVSGFAHPALRSVLISARS